MTDSSIWLDNGFDSLEEMEEKHKYLMSCLMKISHKTSIKSIVDLGAGTGILLNTLCKHFLNTKVVTNILGVESKRDKCEKFPEGIDYINNTVENWAANTVAHFNLGLISISRIVEIPEKYRNMFLSDLAHHIDYLLIYDYNDIPLPKFYAHFQTLSILDKARIVRSNNVDG